MNEVQSQAGLSIKYKVEGEGPLVFLFHGFGGGPQDWSEISPKLAKRYRVVVPNLKVFFSLAKPLSFTEQVAILAEFVKLVMQKKSVLKTSFIAQSYGATLSLGVRCASNIQIIRHTLINPMPFDPLHQVRNKQLQSVLNLGMSSGVLADFFKSEIGRLILTDLAQVFRIGALGKHEVHHFNSRKLELVEKAIERFIWINQNESWVKWAESKDLVQIIPTFRFIYSSQDSLFDSRDYRNFAQSLNIHAPIEADHMGHLLVQDRPEFVLPLLLD